MAARKGKGVSDAAAPDHQRLNVRLSPEAYRRLGVHAIYAGMTPGKLVERLITEHLREYRVQVNSPAGSDRPTPAIESSPAIPAAPF
jgi:hypothetical protein